MTASTAAEKVNKLPTASAIPASNPQPTACLRASGRLRTPQANAAADETSGTAKIMSMQVAP